MRNFEWLEPTSLAEASRLLAEDREARPISGGTALVLLMKRGLLRPSALVSLRRVPDLRYIRRVNGSIAIGSMTSQHEVATSPLVREQLPLLARATSLVGNIRVRVASTVGGSLGEADYQSDLAPALMALDARIHLHGPEGRREVKVEDFFTGPYETCLRPGEVVAGVTVPVPPPGSRGVYLKFVVGPPTDRPALSVAAVGRFDGQGRFEALRLVLGSASGLSSRPLAVSGVEELCVGERPGEALFERVAELAYEQADPISDLRGSAWYKKEIAKVLVRRALAQIAGPEPIR